LIVEELTEHETPPRCIVHGVAIVKENDFFESVCEKIKKERFSGYSSFFAP
jgi:hypothetical protein